MRAHQAYDYVEAVTAMRVTDMLAAGTGDNTEVTGTTIDTKDAMDIVLVCFGKAVLADAETLSIVNIDLQESDDGTSWDADDNQLATDVVLATSSGGSTEDVTFKLQVDLAKHKVRKRYLRFNIIYDLSAGATDTARCGATALLLGKRVKPDNGNELTSEDLAG